jgi:hypothetical protein
MSKFLEMEAYQEDTAIPETIIEKYVQEITVDKDVFTWKLSPNISATDSLSIDARGIDKKGKESSKSMYRVNCCTGCNS